MFWWFRRLVCRLLFRTIRDVMPMLDREQQGREASPSAGVVDNLRSLSIACGNGTFGSSTRPSRPHTRLMATGLTLPRRWVVERTFGWVTRWRKLVRDYEVRMDVSNAMIHLSMSALLLRRVAHPDP